VSALRKNVFGRHARGHGFESFPSTKCLKINNGAWLCVKGKLIEREDRLKRPRHSVAFRHCGSVTDCVPRTRCTRLGNGIEVSERLCSKILRKGIGEQQCVGLTSFSFG